MGQYTRDDSELLLGMASGGTDASDKGTSKDVQDLNDIVNRNSLVKPVWVVTQTKKKKTITHRVEGRFGGLRATGTAPTKKQAKNNAAKNLMARIKAFGVDAFVAACEHDDAEADKVQQLHTYCSEQRLAYPDFQERITVTYSVGLASATAHGISKTKAMREAAGHLLRKLQESEQQGEQHADVRLLETRVMEILRGRPRGLFTQQVERQYVKKFEEPLPPNWSEMLKSVVKVEGEGPEHLVTIVDSRQEESDLGLAVVQGSDASDGMEEYFDEYFNASEVVVDEDGDDEVESPSEKAAVDGREDGPGPEGLVTIVEARQDEIDVPLAVLEVSEARDLMEEYHERETGGIGNNNTAVGGAMDEGIDDASDAIDAVDVDEAGDDEDALREVAAESTSEKAAEVDEEGDVEDALRVVAVPNEVVTEAQAQELAEEKSKEVDNGAKSQNEGYVDTTAGEMSEYEHDHGAKSPNEEDVDVHAYELEMAESDDDRQGISWISSKTGGTVIEADEDREDDDGLREVESGGAGQKEPEAKDVELSQGSLSEAAAGDHREGDLRASRNEMEMERSRYVENGENFNFKFEALLQENFGVGETLEAEVEEFDEISKDVENPEVDPDTVFQSISVGVVLVDNNIPIFDDRVVEFLNDERIEDGWTEALLQRLRTAMASIESTITLRDPRFPVFSQDPNPNFRRCFPSDAVEIPAAGCIVERGLPSWFHKLAKVRELVKVVHGSEDEEESDNNDEELSDMDAAGENQPGNDAGTTLKNSTYLDLSISIRR